MGDCATLTVPADAKDGDVYYANLVSGPQVVGSDSFIVQVPSDTSKDASNNDPKYVDPVLFTGTGGTVAAPKNSDDSDLPSGTTFAPGVDVPAGFTVNPDGTIKVDPSVASSDTPYSIPVVVTYPDGSKETVYAPVTVKAAPVDPAPTCPETTAPAGKGTTSTPTSDVPVPAGTKYTIDPNYTVPDGWTVTIDETTGVVTATPATPGPHGANDEQISVPVLVTYPDGTTTGNDTATAVFNLDNDGDGIPDATDTDDDGDGISDADEIAKGSDPKDPNSKPAETPVAVDTDGDGIPDSIDTDDDNDGVSDGDEKAAGLDPRNTDTDGGYQQSDDSLAYTGAAGVGALTGAGILALVAGGILVAARRRKNA